MYHHEVPDHIPDEAIVPRPALIALVLLVVLSVAGIAAATLSGVELAGQPLGATAASRSVTFESDPAGGLAVHEAGSGVLVGTLPAGPARMLDAVLKDLDAARRTAGAMPGTPFVLARHADGAVSLGDPATGRRIALQAFGHDNARLLGALVTAAPLAAAGR